MEITNYAAQEAEALKIFRGMPDSVELVDVPAGAAAALLSEIVGVDPADFEVTTTYGIFNDPAFWEPLFADGSQPEALRVPLLETPIYEDKSASRALAHARLMNSDRRREGKLAAVGEVIVRRRVTLESPWLDGVGEE